VKHAVAAALPRALTVGAILLLLQVAASAAGPRLYIGSAGADGNPCTTAAPCRTLQYAVSAVDDGGEVIIIDSAGYGPVTIAKSVSVVAPAGVYAGITVSSGAGVDVNGAGIRVLLEGLTITGLGAGTTGVRLLAGTDLRLANCTISAMTGAGLVATATGAKVFVRDVAYDANATAASLAGVTATLVDVRAAGNGTGIDIGAGARVTVRGGAITGSAGPGIAVANAAGTATTLAVDSTLIAQNATGISLYASGAGSTLSAGVIRSTIVRNAGDGVAASAVPPATTTVTLTANDISDQAVGVRAQNAGVTLLATGNTIARNRVGGLVQSAGAMLQSLGNNTVDPALSPPTTGTVTTAAGY
jgi:hypothetical protein